MNKIEITRRLEFDAGHRIPNHEGQCRHLHGHRYRLEVTVSGDVISTPGANDEGMLIDFGLIKKIANELVVEPWDHSFIVYRDDKNLTEFLSSIPKHKTVILDKIPTVENLAQHIFNVLSPEISKQYKNHLRLTKIRMYETPNCWADISNAA
jgi:6-pyruvoyltetrahydropterin/6-carboxytetrahydropterin synthase